MTAVFWTGKDKQGSYDMGSLEDYEGMTEEQITNSVYDALLSQCTDDEQRAAIRAGSVTIETD